MTTATVNLDALWIRRYEQAQPGAAQLICLPHAGGSAAFFLPVARALAGRCEVLAIQYPGRQERLREPLLDSVDKLADEVFPLLRRQVRGPFALFGHSLGATLGFELARRFEASGLVPAALFTSARTAPSRQRAGSVHLCSDEELIDRLRALGGTDERIFEDEDLMRLSLPVVRSDYTAAETYEFRAGQRLTCPVHAFIGRDDPVVNEEEARAWADHTKGSFALHTYSGGHFYLADHQQEVLEVITRQLLQG
jgi:surfactin synthase thioesterase subunit